MVLFKGFIFGGGAFVSVSVVNDLYNVRVSLKYHFHYDLASLFSGISNSLIYFMPMASFKVNSKVGDRS